VDLTGVPPPVPITIFLDQTKEDGREGALKRKSEEQGGGSVKKFKTEEKTIPVQSS
jgi:hypothetical protein